MINNNKGGKVMPKCDHNSELYYSSLFDENARETRVKRCMNCHQIVEHVQRDSPKVHEFQSINRSHKGR